MTLITYLTRVHFADGVLEEAVWSELEAAKRKRPFIIFDGEFADTPSVERLLSSLPVRTKAEVFAHTSDVVKESKAIEIAQTFLENQCDCLLAFGSANTMDLAKVARVAIAHFKDIVPGGQEPQHVGLSAYTDGDGGSRRIDQTLPDLLAIPGISGFSSAVNTQAQLILKSGEYAVMNCKRLIPTVAICDPTLTFEASGLQSASAGVAAISECIEAIASKGYNPPAEGIAINGLMRGIRNLPLVLEGNSSPSARREMMAASLNAALALQKGLGASKAISNSLQLVSGKTLDQGVLHRIALPLVLAFNEREANDRLAPVRQIFSSTCGSDLSAAVEKFFLDLGLPTSFGEIGLNDSDFEGAAILAQNDTASRTNPRRINRHNYLSIMQEAQ